MLSKFFIERPVLSNVLALVLILIGLISIFRLPVAEYPNVAPPTVQVTASYPGASAQTVANTIALPIELQVNGVDRMLYMESTSADDGTYKLTVTFEIGTNPDIDQVLVQNRVQIALASLPESVKAQGVNVQKQSPAILQIVTLDSPTGAFDSLYMSNFATINLLNDLARLPGVGQAKVFGAGTYSMRIWLDPEKLYSFGLSPKDVINVIRQQSSIVAAGQIGMPPAPADQAFQYIVDVPGSRMDEVEQFADIIVKEQTAEGGRLVRVRDVARIEMGSQTYAQSFLLDGRPAAGISIYQTPEANSLQVAEAVAKKMAELSKRFPQGLRYSIPFDTSVFVKASVNEVYTTLWQAGVLVLIVILVFLQNFRATLIPATTIPVTIIGAFAAMSALGFTVNLSTLFGIVLAIGIVVDDAIVVVESVSKYLEEGMSGPEAATKAMSELFGPIVGITLVLMSVFLPASFVPGLSGNMFAAFALVIAATALISAINAATLSPTQCAMWLRMPVPPEKRNFFYRAFNKVYAKVEGRYLQLIRRMVSRYALMVLIGLGLAVVSFIGIARLPTGFIPDDDQGWFMIAIQLPDGAAQGRTVAAQNLTTKIALDTPGVDRVIAISGTSILDNSADLNNAGVSYVILKPWEERGKAKDQDIVSVLRSIQARLNEIEDGRAFVLIPPPILGIGNAGGFQMQVEMLGGGFDYLKLASITTELIKNTEGNPDISRTLTTFRPSAPTVSVTVDRARAETLRVPVGDIFNTLTSYLGSTYVNQFNKFGLSLQVYVQADSKFRLEPEDILKLTVRSQDGRMIPLESVVTIGPAVSPPLVTLYNLHASATVSGSPPRGISSGQSMTAMEAVANKTLPNDMDFEWTGMSYQEKLTGNQLYYLFALSVLLVYLCLAAQYESWFLPLAVLSAVPLALAGPATALTALGVANNLYTQIGLMLLIALSAKNGILIVEVARELRLVHGKPLLDAAVEASKTRFRPILMTSFAFILGVLPLVFAEGAGANARRSLGIAVFSGMLASTCLAVLFVPSFFVALQKLDERFKGKKAKAAVPVPEA